MMERIPVEVCAGTTCYVLGGSELTDIESALPQFWRECVIISGETCLGLSRGSAVLKPPFVLIGDQAVEQASSEKVLAVLGENCYEPE